MLQTRCGADALLRDALCWLSVAERMEAAEGGLSRFGALSTVLFDMSTRWEEFTPPYILLLIRTFLTLEGVAGQVDENFNIYEAALPWAIQVFV